MCENYWAFRNAPSRNAPSFLETLRLETLRLETLRQLLNQHIHQQKDQCVQKHAILGHLREHARGHGVHLGAGKDVEQRGVHERVEHDFFLDGSDLHE